MHTLSFLWGVNRPEPPDDALNDEWKGKGLGQWNDNQGTPMRQGVLEPQQTRPLMLRKGYSCYRPKRGNTCLFVDTLWMTALNLKKRGTDTTVLMDTTVSWWLRSQRACRMGKFTNFSTEDGSASTLVGYPLTKGGSQDQSPKDSASCDSL